MPSPPATVKRNRIRVANDVDGWPIKHKCLPGLVGIRELVGNLIQAMPSENEADMPHAVIELVDKLASQLVEAAAEVAEHNMTMLAERPLHVFMRL